MAETLNVNLEQLQGAHCKWGGATGIQIPRVRRGCACGIGGGRHVLGGVGCSASGQGLVHSFMLTWKIGERGGDYGRLHERLVSALFPLLSAKQAKAASS